MKERLNLYDFVREALPERLVNIMDPTLVYGEIAEEIYNHEKLSHVKQCLVSVLEIGVACSMESPIKRMSMKNVSKKLHRIKDAFLRIQIQINRR